MNSVLKDLLMSAVKKYGSAENICSIDELNKKWERCTAEGSGEIPDASDLRVRAVIIGLGKIVEEDLEKYTDITTIKVGKGIGVNEALMVTLRKGNTVYYAACAHEGFISQHIAEKAVALVAERIATLPPFSKQSFNS